MRLRDQLLDGYHAHLDECARCRETPLDPCVVGGVLLGAAALASARVAKAMPLPVPVDAAEDEAPEK